METQLKKAKMPIYRSEHDIIVSQVAQELQRKNFVIIIDTTDKKLSRIPDLLAVSPKGKLHWVEVESQQHGKKKKKLKHIVHAIHQVSGKVVIRYMED